MGLWCKAGLVTSLDPNSLFGPLSHFLLARRSVAVVYFAPLNTSSRTSTMYMYMYTRSAFLLGWTLPTHTVSPLSFRLAHALLWPYSGKTAKLVRRVGAVWPPDRFCQVSRRSCMSHWVPFWEPLLYSLAAEIRWEMAHSFCLSAHSIS